MGLLTKDRVLSFGMLTLGAIIAAFALEEFLVPNDIFDGGVVGLAMIGSRFVPVSMGFLTILLNIPFAVFGKRKMGGEFVVRFCYATVLFSAMTGVFTPMANATGEVILAVTFGGFILGVGVGLVMRGGGCLDGTEIVAIFANRTWSISVGKVILGVNVLVYTLAGIAFGLDRGMYSLLMYFITSKVVDMVEIGWDNAKSVMVVTDDATVLAELIYARLGRTVTFMSGRGLVSDARKDVLFCVVTRAEIFELKRILAEVPGSTFTSISDVSEIVGNHVKSSEEIEDIVGETRE